ncbi:MAG: hypothetical protein IPF94_00400 [Betaproteobacteria bacterium]|nr:hypothetical protein [Betaproteobacteria bacterium]
MDPAWLFPLLAIGFAIAAAQRWLRTRRWQGAAATWALMAFIFAAVAVWLRMGP